MLNLLGKKHFFHPYELPEYCTNLGKKVFYYSVIAFVHLIFIFKICELSFNRDLAHC